MPDVGNSWYVNWAENEDGQSNNWEDHVIRDVVSHVDWNFRTIARREGRAMTGLSMGGFGAITMGLRNPGMFISIGSTSGALEFGRQAAARMRGRDAAARAARAHPRAGSAPPAAEPADRHRRLLQPGRADTARSDVRHPGAGRRLRPVQADSGDPGGRPAAHLPRLRHRGPADCGRAGSWPATWPSRTSRSTTCRCPARTTPPTGSRRSATSCRCSTR